MQGVKLSSVRSFATIGASAKTLGWSPLCATAKLPAKILTLMWLYQLTRHRECPDLVTQTTADLAVTPIRRQFHPARSRVDVYRRTDRSIATGDYGARYDCSGAHTQAQYAS